MAPEDGYPQKRSSTAADFHAPAAKRPRLAQLRHHKLNWNSEGSKEQSLPSQDQDSIHCLLTRSIGLALECVGFQGAEPVAIESFRAAAEEYMAHFLKSARQSMVSCRRNRPIAQDFLQALHGHQLSLRSLIPHLDPPVPPSKSKTNLSLKPVEDEHETTFPLPATGLQGASAKYATSHIPSHFPAFPSYHTYKWTPQFTVREEDPRKIRERATEEGRLGEEALRRLMGGGSSDVAIMAKKQIRDPKDLRARRDQLWKETMSAILQTSEKGSGVNLQSPMPVRSIVEAGISTNFVLEKGRLSSTVNADRKYWRKGASARTSGHSHGSG